jgi:quinol monooxygenase YgiN
MSQGNEMTVQVFVEIQAKSGLAPAASKVIAESRAFCLTQAACSKFEVYQLCDDIHKFRFVEIWDSIEDHKRVLSGLMAGDAFRESMNVFAGGPIIEYYKQVDPLMPSL